MGKENKSGISESLKPDYEKIDLYKKGFYEGEENQKAKDEVEFDRYKDEQRKLFDSEKEKAYQQGLKVAWLYATTVSKLTVEERSEVFGSYNIYEIFKNNTVLEAIDRLRYNGPIIIDNDSDKKNISGVHKNYSCETCVNNCIAEQARVSCQCKKVGLCNKGQCFKQIKYPMCKTCLHIGNTDLCTVCSDCDNYEEYKRKKETISANLSVENILGDASERYFKDGVEECAKYTKMMLNLSATELATLFGGCAYPSKIFSNYDIYSIVSILKTYEENNKRDRDYAVNKVIDLVNELGLDKINEILDSIKIV